MRCRPRLVTLAALLVLLAGCAETTQGSPTPGAETTTGSGEDTTTSEPEPSGGGLADVGACDLLDDAGAAALQLTGGNELTLGGARVCEYRREGATLNESFTVSVSLWDEQGIDDLNASEVQPLPDIGGHQAVSFVDAAGACGVGIAVGDSARADGSAVGGDQRQACQLAQQLAAAIEPELP